MGALRVQYFFMSSSSPEGVVAEPPDEAEQGRDDDRVGAPDLPRLEFDRLFHLVHALGDIAPAHGANVLMRGNPRRHIIHHVTRFLIDHESAMCRIPDD